MTKRKNVMTPICVIGCFVLSLSARPVAAQSWKPLNPPAPRFYHSTAYDPTTNQMFVFGGLKGGPLNATGLLNDVWRLTSADGPGLSWFRLTPTGTPPARRSGAQTVYNPGSNKLVLFGGGLGFTSPCANDVWTLNNANGNGGIPSWAELTPSGTPPAPREDFAAVYDPTSDGMIVFGGDTCFTPRFNDVWVLYNADGVGGTPTWTQLSPTGVPPTPRDHCAAVYNPNLNVMIVFGGSDESGNRYNDLWVLSDANGLGGTPAWTEIFPTGGPPTARDSQSAVYDVADDRMTIYGGSCCGSGTSTQILGDAWVLSNATGMTGTPTWTELGPFKRSPDRTAHTGVYNASTNQMTIFGGAATVSGNSTNSVWILSKANGLSPSEMDK